MNDEEKLLRSRYNVLKQERKRLEGELKNVPKGSAKRNELLREAFDVSMELTAVNELLRSYSFGFNYIDILLGKVFLGERGR